MSPRQTTVKIQLNNLEAFTNYSCSSSVLNTAGWSNESPLRLFQTREGNPEPPSNLTQVFMNSSLIKIEWNEPENSRGMIIGYFVEIEIIRRDCNKRALKSFYNATDNFFMIENPSPYSEYFLEVSTMNNAEIGKSSQIKISTPPALPSTLPTNLQIISQSEPKINSYNVSINLQWEIMKCSLNGKLEYFKIIFQGTRYKQENHSFEMFYYVQDNFKSLFFSWEESAVKPEYSYEIQVFIKNEGVEELSEPAVMLFDAVAGSK